MPDRTKLARYRLTIAGDLEKFCNGCEEWKSVALDYYPRYVNGSRRPKPRCKKCHTGSGLMVPYKDVRPYILMLRKRTNTQKEVAELIGITEANLNRLLHKPPTKVYGETAKKIFLALQTSSQILDK